VTAPAKAGLEDVVATSSAICFIDGDRGILSYRGYDIHDLARFATFEETCYLLWHGRLPNRAELGDLQSQLAAARPLPEAILRLMKMLPPSQGAPGAAAAAGNGDGMDALRTLTSALGHYDRDASDNSQQASYRKSVRLTAQIAGLVATWGRMQQGGNPVAPDPAMGHAANFLYMLTGDRPSATAVRAMDIALTLHADHELNASTFAARVAAATLTDVHSAVVAGVGTLKGPLHGGANAEVMKMLLEIGMDAPPERIDSYIRGKLSRKEKISGFGHRVYHTEDPRATHLRRMSKELGEKAGNTRWFDMSERIEALVRGEKKLNPNVDFYSASTYYTMGIPIDLYTPIFAVSRISGWTAHILEQYANNRLIRPRADYTGPPYPQTWVPLEQR
jgi:2-methylcitrate synthase